MPRDRHWNEPNLGPTDVVHQHVVPRMYLAHFAIDGRVAAYDFEEDRGFDASVKDVAVRTGFYDVLIGRQKVSTESWLAVVEGAAASIIGRLIDDPKALLTLSTEDEEALGRFICAQMFRVQSFREDDGAMRQQLLQDIKERTRTFLENTAPSKEVGEDLWEYWQGKPDEWWLRESEPYQPASTAASMLSEVQGFSNILRAMPWRIGLADPGQTVYTSDNPVSRYRPPLALWAGFAAFTYFAPLSPKVLLRIGPGYDPNGQGRREQRDFSAWDTCLARHVITANASRFLYGPGPYVPPACAHECLQRLDSMKAACAAVGLSGQLAPHEKGYATNALERPMRSPPQPA